MIKRALIYGVAAAAGVFLWMTLEFALGFHTSRAEVGRYTGVLALILPVLAIVAAIRGARRESGGAIGFGNAVIQGFAVTVAFSLLGPVTVWLYHVAINPAFLESEAAGGVTLGGQALLTLVSGLVVGAAVSLAAALLLRRPAAATRPR